MGLKEIQELKENIRANKGKKIPKKVYYIPKKSTKKIAAEKAEKESRGNSETDLQKWYNYIMKNEEPICWETGDPINKNDQLGWHGSIAHILPKKKFDSVKTHPLNYVILKMWGGVHGNFDNNWKKAQTMKVWPIVVERFKEIYPDIAQKERKFIPQCLLKHINDAN
jgi:hypothetical protein